MSIPFSKQNKDFWKIAPTMIEGIFTKMLIKNKRDEKIWEQHYIQEIRSKLGMSGTINQKTQRNPIPAALRHEVFKRDNYTCQECGASRRPLEVDHIIPVSQGGTDEMDNLRTLCLRCNRDKNNRKW